MADAEAEAADLHDRLSAADERIVSLEGTVTQAKDQLVRLGADFDNYRKRTVRPGNSQKEHAQAQSCLSNHSTPHPPSILHAGVLGRVVARGVQRQQESELWPGGSSASNSQGCGQGSPAPAIVRVVARGVQRQQ